LSGGADLAKGLGIRLRSVGELTHKVRKLVVIPQQRSFCVGITKGIKRYYRIFSDKKWRGEYTYVTLLLDLHLWLARTWRVCQNFKNRPWV